LEARSQVKEATIEATVIRRDGSRDELGVVSYWHKNPLRRIAWKVFQWRGG